MRVMVLHADELGVLLERPLRREVLGVQVVRDRLAPRRRASRGRGRCRCGTRGRRARVSRSPRCGERNASCPRATQNVLFSSAPTARSGRAARTGSGTASGANPRERRIGKRRADDRVLAAPVDRTVVAEERVGDPAEPLARLVVVVGDRLVRAVAARHHERSAEVGEQQVVERRVREHHAEPRAARRDRRSDRRVRAPAHEHDRPLARARAARPRPSSTSREQPPGASSSARTACPRGACARAAAPTAASSAASQARCQPPRPLTATIAPPRSRSTASSSGSESRGPQTAQQIGSAWKRRSAGSSYSRRQSAQSGNAGHRRVRPVVRDRRGRS